MSRIQEKLKKNQEVKLKIEEEISESHITPTEAEKDHVSEIVRLISDKFAEQLRTRSKEELKDEIADAIERECAKLDIPFRDQKRIEKIVMMTSLGYGPIEEYLHDPEVTEIVVQRYDNIVIERNGKIEKSDAQFYSENHLLNTINAMIQKSGRQINLMNPIADGSLEDGSRINAAIPPVAVNGATVTIRKFSNSALTGRDYLDKGSLNKEMLYFLERCVKGRVNIIVSGGTGSGKTTLILESLIPGLEALLANQKLPEHVLSIEAQGISRVKLIDATPIGINVRSTVATYANVHDELRKIYARTQEAKRLGWKAGDFSYNTGRLRCPLCDGTGVISLDVQFLPDVEIACPDCHGSRYAKNADTVRIQAQTGKLYSLPELMAMDINTALPICAEMKTVQQRLQILKSLGLGYLTLGEATPSLSGGEAQRLKLASEMGKEQSDTVFVFDEPTIGLHPLDVQTLLCVFQTLIDNGATVIVIEHDLDLIRNADYVIDMGPGGGDEGGRIVAFGTPSEIAQNPDSITGRYLR